MTLPGFHECPECVGVGQIQRVVEVVVPGHALNCGGETCERTCPVPYQQQDIEVESCPECGGAGQVPDDDTVETVKSAIGEAFIREMGWGESKPFSALRVYAIAEGQARAALLAYAQKDA